MWKKCLDCIDELLDILFNNNNIFIGENIAEDSESLAVSDQVSLPSRLALCPEKACKVSVQADPRKESWVREMWGGGAELTGVTYLFYRISFVK